MCCEKALKPAQLRPQADYLRVTYRVSERRSCEVLTLTQASYCYQSRADEQAPLWIPLRDRPRPG